MENILNSILPKMRYSTANLHVSSQGKIRKLTYNEVFNDVLKARAYINNLGLVSGSSLGVLADNCYEWILLDFACLSLGIILIPFDPKINNSAEELIRYYALDALFCKNVSNINSKIYSLSVLLEEDSLLTEDDMPFYTYNSDSIVCMKFTSGTTSLPKGIPATAKNVANCIEVIQQAFQHDSEDLILIFLPLYLLQQRYFIYSSILYNVSIIVVPYIFSFVAISTLHPTTVMAVPYFLEKLLQLYKDRIVVHTNKQDLSNENERAFILESVFGKHLRYLWTGSAAISSGLLKEYSELGIPVYQGYGTAETGILTKNTPENNRYGSVGKVLPGRNIKIGKSNEIFAYVECALNTNYCDGPISNIGMRYLDKEGYFLTGDLGYFDSDGYLYITGRSKNVIVLPNGRKINPETIENKVISETGIKTCVLFNLPNSKLVAVIETSLCYEQVNNIISSINTTLQFEDRIIGFIICNESLSREAGLRNAQGKILRDKVFSKYSNQLLKIFYNN